MTIASVGALGTGTSTTAGTSVAATTGAAAEAGNLVVVIVGLDNTQTTDGQTSEVSSISDSAGGNTWTKAGEFCNGQGGAGNGAVASVWFSRLATQINSGGTITANLANTVTAKALTAWEFTVGADVQVASDTAAAYDAAFGTLSISSLPSKEYLFVRGDAAETRNTSTYTPTTDFTEITTAGADTGVFTTSIQTTGEFRILTGTEASSTPTSSAETNQRVSVFVALEEISASTQPPRSMHQFRMAA